MGPLPLCGGGREGGGFEEDRGQVLSLLQGSTSTRSPSTLTEPGTSLIVRSAAAGTGHHPPGRAETSDQETGWPNFKCSLQTSAEVTANGCEAFGSGTTAGMLPGPSQRIRYAWGQTVSRGASWSRFALG